MKKLLFALLCGLAAAASSSATAAEVKVLSAGAMEKVVRAMIPDFERRTGHRVAVVADTVGGLTNRIQNGETFDVAVMTPQAINDLTMKGFMDGASRIALARVGVGVVVKEGAPLPDISTADAFRRALLAAPSVGYIDPAAGGSSGIYFNGLIERMGIAQEIRAKAKLKPGGAVADLVVSGEAAIGIHQVSEIVGYPGVRLVGPLPADIQNYTTYGAAVGLKAREPGAGHAFKATLATPSAALEYRARGLEPLQ
jgi:molybdate transport system substrate-binding protein